MKTAIVILALVSAGTCTVAASIYGLVPPQVYHTIALGLATALLALCSRLVCSSSRVAMAAAAAILLALPGILHFTLFCSLQSFSPWDLGWQWAWQRFVQWPTTTLEITCPTVLLLGLTLATLRSDRARQGRGLRFSLRSMMLAVALTALPLGLITECRRRYEAWNNTPVPLSPASNGYSLPPREELDWAINRWRLAHYMPQRIALGLAAELLRAIPQDEREAALIAIEPGFEQSYDVYVGDPERMTVTWFMFHHRKDEDEDYYYLEEYWPYSPPFSKVFPGRN